MVNIMKNRGFGWGGYVIWLLPLALLFVLGRLGWLSGNVMRYLLQICLYITLGEAWNLLSGFAGMTSLGQQLYVGLAGYALAVAAEKWGLPLPACLACGVLVCLGAAAAVCMLLLRIQGMYFAIATWVAAEAVQKLFLSWKYVGQGGGMTVNLSPYPRTPQIFEMALVLCTVSILLICGILRSRMGLALMALRDDSVTAAAIGIRVRRVKFAVYLIGALLSGLAGALFFVSKGVIYPDSGFAVSWTVSAVFICIIGGTGTVTGPVAGAVVYVLLREYLAHFPGWSNIILGVITIIVILFPPDGIAGAARRMGDRGRISVP